MPRQILGKILGNASGRFWGLPILLSISTVLMPRQIVGKSSANPRANSGWSDKSSGLMRRQLLPACKCVLRVVEQCETSRGQACVVYRSDVLRGRVHARAMLFTNTLIRPLRRLTSAIVFLAGNLHSLHWLSTSTSNCPAMPWKLGRRWHQDSQDTGPAIGSSGAAYQRASRHTSVQVLCLHTNVVLCIATRFKQ